MTDPEAIDKIGEEGGTEAVSLLAKLMQHNAEQDTWVRDQLIEGYKADAEYWKGRALEAEGRLHRALRRLGDFFD